MDEKSWTDVHKDEVLSDNSEIEYCKQCKDCIFRSDGTLFSNHYTKACCMIYPDPGHKPLHVINNKGICEYHSKEDAE